MASVSRRAYIDWLRGVAVLCMIEWHSVDSWTVSGVRDGNAFAVLMLIGGWAAPLFLFLAGLALPLAGQSHLRKGLDLRAASWAVQKRGWQIFGIAHLFRLQSFLLNPTARVGDLVRPDILNILGMGMALAAFCWGRATSRVGRTLWLLVPAVAIALLAPSSRTWAWPSLLDPRLEAYLRPVSDEVGTPMSVFQIFPWMGYVFLGTYVGSLIAADRTERADRAFHLRLGATGLVLGVAGWLTAGLAPGDFWTTSPSLFLLRAGGMTLGLSLAWAWMKRPTAQRWSPMVLFGRTSLFVYWVHVEIAYGFISQALHHELSIGWSLTACLALTAFMLWLAVLWARRDTTRPWIPESLRGPQSVVLGP